MKTSNSIKMIIVFFLLCTSCSKSPVPAFYERVIAEMNIGESQDVTIDNGEVIHLKLLSVEPVCDNVRKAIRSAEVKILIDGEEAVIKTGNYNLPVTVGNVQIDCPVIKPYYNNADQDAWKLQKDVRFRLWPKESPWIEPGTFAYPIKQAWLASMTQASNEPTWVDWGENPLREKIYYHSGVDLGGAEGLDEIVSATNGIVISARNEKLEGYDHVPAYVIYDAVNVLDERGWLVRYVHLDSTDNSIQLGSKIKIGQRIGYIGKQGASGGWVHLHFAVSSVSEISGEWISEDTYPYLWESYINEYKPDVIAVARPHQLTWIGETVLLDGSKSKSLSGDIVSYDWTLSNGINIRGVTQKIIYDKPGEYSEILKVTDSNGNIAYDFTVVQVRDPENPERAIPTIHASYHPTLGIRTGDTVSFFARTFNSNTGNEVWDFGDGSPMVSVKSDFVERSKTTVGKYSEARHSFEKSGQYVVRVERSNELGYEATIYLHVVVH